MRSISLLILCILVARLGAEDSWKGLEVLPKKDPKNITFSDRVDGKNVRFELHGVVFKVRTENDGQLRLFDGYREGWVDKADVALPAEAHDYWNEQVKREPKDGWPLFMRGVAKLKKSEIEGAIRDFDECIRLDPKNSAALRFRANSFAFKNEYDRSITDYDEAIRLDPKSAVAYRNRGLSFYFTSRYDRAIKDLDEAVRLEPNYVDAILDRGFTHRRMKNYDSAIKDFDEVIRLDPNDPVAFQNRGNTYALQFDYDRAIKEYDKAIRLDPKYIDAYRTRATTFSVKQEFVRAIEDYDVVVRLDPKNSSGFAGRAYAHSKCRDYKQALSDYETALKLAGGSKWLTQFAAFRASCPEAKFRDGKMAVEMARRGIELAGKNVNGEHHAALAAAYAENGDFDMAIAEQKLAIADERAHVSFREEMKRRLKLFEKKEPFRDE